jgi:biopolymer transport protein ExbD
MNFRKRLKEKPELHTSALNDILFILLLFFLIVSTLANPNIVKVNTPKCKSDSKAKQSIVVSIDNKHNVYIGQKPVPLFAIDSLLKEATQKMGLDTPVITINADTSAMYGEFFRVLNAAKKAGAKVTANVSSN